MSEEELKDLCQDTIERIAQYANCSEASAEKILLLMEPSFSTVGGLCYHVSDNMCKAQRRVDRNIRIWDL